MDKTLDFMILPKAKKIKTQALKREKYSTHFFSQKHLQLTHMGVSWAS